MQHPSESYLLFALCEFTYKLNGDYAIYRIDGTRKDDRCVCERTEDSPNLPSLS